MSVTSEEREFHLKYEALQNIKAKNQGLVTYGEIIDEAFNQVEETFKGYGIATPFDDRAEALISAITKYLLSANDIKGVN